MNDKPKQANEELTESELTQVTGGFVTGDPKVFESLVNDESVISDETTAIVPHKAGMEWW